MWFIEDLFKSTSNDLDHDFGNPSPENYSGAQLYYVCRSFDSHVAF